MECLIYRSTDYMLDCEKKHRTVLNNVLNYRETINRSISVINLGESWRRYLYL